MSVESVELLRRENTKKIIRTLQDLLNEEDPSTLSLAKIAQRAGVAVKTINNIFGTKNSLIIQTAISAYADEHALLDELVASSAFAALSGLDQVMELHYARAKFQQKWPYMGRVVAEVERLKLSTEEEVSQCNRYLTLADSITAYYDAPIQKGHRDGSIKKDVTEAEIHAILFFAFGAVMQKLQIVNAHALMRQRINPYAALRIILNKTRDFISA